jgi:hypothetical protein
MDLLVWLRRRGPNYYLRRDLAGCVPTFGDQAGFVDHARWVGILAGLHPDPASALGAHAVSPHAVRTGSDDYRNLGVWAAPTVSSWRFSSRLVGVNGLGRGGVGLRAPTAAADLPSDSQTSLHRAATSRIPRGTAPQHTTSRKNVKLNNLPPDAWLA